MGCRIHWKTRPFAQAVLEGFLIRGKTFRVGLYARVSTQDQQTPPMQLAAMRDYAKRRGWVVATESKEVGSGAKTRPLREKLLKAARRLKSCGTLRTFVGN